MIHYGGVLRQSTEIVVAVPVMGADGYTPDTTGIRYDAIHVAKNGAGDGVLSSPGANTTTGYGGMNLVRVTLLAADVNTCGYLVLRLDASACSQDTWAFYTVISQVAYDALMGVDPLPVNVTEVDGAAQDIATATDLDSVVYPGILLAVGAVAPAVLTGALPELTKTPPATPSLQQAVMLPFMAVRNGRTQSSTEMTVKNDAGDVIGVKAIHSTPSLLTAEKMTDPVTTTTTLAPT